MAQLSKVEVEVELKCSPDKFYEIYRSKLYLLPKICPEYLSDIRVIEGDWISTGSVKEWTYNISNGNFIKSKETTTMMDDRNKSITFDVLEGVVKKYYKTFLSTIQATTKGDGTRFAKYVVEYEKQNEDVPDPTNYLDLTAVAFKQVDAYLLRENI